MKYTKVVKDGSADLDGNFQTYARRGAGICLACWALYFAGHALWPILHHGAGYGVAVWALGGAFESLHTSIDGSGFAMASLDPRPSWLKIAVLYATPIGLTVAVGSVSVGVGRKLARPWARLALTIPAWVTATRSLETIVWGIPFDGPEASMLLWGLGNSRLWTWSLFAASLGIWIVFEVLAITSCIRFIDSRFSAGKDVVRAMVLIGSVGGPLWCFASVYPYKDLFPTGGYFPAAAASVGHGVLLLIFGLKVKTRR
jgi:hypothetical protein